MTIVKLIARDSCVYSGITEDDVISNYCAEFGISIDDILNDILVTVEITSIRTKRGCKVYEKIINSVTVSDYVNRWWS